MSAAIAAVAVSAYGVYSSNKAQKQAAAKQEEAGRQSEEIAKKNVALGEEITAEELRRQELATDKYKRKATTEINVFNRQSIFEERGAVRKRARDAGKVYSTAARRGVYVGSGSVVDQYADTIDEYERALIEHRKTREVVNREANLDLALGLSEASKERDFIKRKWAKEKEVIELGGTLAKQTAYANAAGTKAQATQTLLSGASTIFSIGKDAGWFTPSTPTTTKTGTG